MFVEKRIKVACVGNMNNNMFSLTRWLRDFGIDAELLLFDDEKDLFLPRSDSQEVVNGAPWIKRLSWGSVRSFFLTSPMRIRRDLENYDIVIGCGFLPAFLERASLVLDIFAPYGEDLYCTVTEIRKRGWKYYLTSYFRRYQIKGIQNCAVSTMVLGVRLYEEAIQLTGVRNYPLGTPHIYSPEYNAWHEENLEYASFFKKLRENHDVIVFNHCRQIWRTFINDASWKGNDIVIRGFAEYLKKARKKAVLVLFEYGIDVNASKGLIRQLGIENNVVWLPRMARKEILYGLSLADFGSDILVPSRFSALNGTSGETMMLGKPLFVNLIVTPEEHKKLTLNRPFPPVVNVRSSKDIARVLLDYEANPEAYREIGRKARIWFERYMGEGLVKKWIYLIETLHQRGEIDIRKLEFS